MTQISLTDLVDIVSLSGRPKATRVRLIKKRPPYDPASDFYRRIRETIIESHDRNQDKDFIDTAMATLTDPKKATAYPAIAKAYKRWWGRKNLVWFEPPDKIYMHSGIGVSVNPELGLKIDGKPHLIKLYFKTKPLEKPQIDIITHLMSITLSDLCPSPENTIMSVLDIRRARLVAPTVPIPSLNGMLQAELAYIAALWPTL